MAREAQELALRAARFAAEDYTRLIGEGKRLPAVLARVPDVRAGERPACSELLADPLKQDTRYANFGVVELDGRVRCRRRRM